MSLLPSMRVADRWIDTERDYSHMTADCTLGILAFGDSITNGGGELQWGVALQSWAQWVARGLGLPYSGYAADGARVADVVGQQIPLLQSTRARTDARYELGCLYIGVNDVRAPDFSASEFEHGFRAALEFLVARCERVLAVTIPVRLGVPGARPWAVAAANGAIEAAARQAGALLVDLRHFGARNLVMADRVHPTAFGQIAIAERALAVVAADGLSTRVQPRSLICFETTWWGRLRADFTYVWRYAKVVGGGALSAIGAVLDR